MGQVLQAGVGQAPARQAAVGAGIPKEVPADTINKVCASSIRAIEIADSDDPGGRARRRRHRRDGVDVERAVPSPKARFGYRLGNGELRRPHGVRRATSTFDGLHMVEQASKVSRELGISREEQDEWAYRSHQRAAAAQDAGPLRRRDRRGRRRRRGRGHPPGHDAREARLAAAGLRPRGDDDRGQRAGRQRRRLVRRSCAPRSSRERRGIEPLATILAQGYVADDFAYLARTPAQAGEQALSTAGKSIGDVKRVEINEAFSSVAKNSTRMLGADEEIVNVNGGAVALGHPIGASGGRIVGDDGARAPPEGGGLGLAAICSGGGQGDALLIEV